MKTTTICQGCWEQMHVPIAIRGPFSILYKAIGIRKSRMHPNLCTVCESMFTKVKKHKQIATPVTILFADIRGYTDLSQSAETSKLNELLHTFYDQCSLAVWEKDGIVNKFIGDAVLAIFNFPLNRKDHVRNAVEAAIDLQKNCHDLKDSIGLGENKSFGVGIGIHTGECYIGEVGTAYKDFTAIGSVVNLASRLQSAAGPGEILLTSEVFRSVSNDFPGSENRMLSLKGFEHQVSSYVLG
ncbi:adenylate/guanylate cyclase domain-containing protein [Pollutibacter soli]|uniref:adenylate/guanylate cyclase domain-containing protein n=1 Tax=Pollutibacter soli TaxID=3034157 RepID=UPI00301322AD